MKEDTKTLAFQISMELSDRVKATLERHTKYHHKRLTLKEFGIGQLIKGVEESEAEERERLANMTEEEKMRASFNPLTGEYGYVPAGYRKDGTRIAEDTPAAEDGNPTEEEAPAAEDGNPAEGETPAAEDGNPAGKDHKPTKGSKKTGSRGRRGA